jgi:hypothetical protein
MQITPGSGFAPMPAAPCAQARAAQPGALARGQLIDLLV